MHIQIQIKDNSGYKFGIFFGIFEKRSTLSEKKPPLAKIEKRAYFELSLAPGFALALSKRSQSF